MILRLINRLSDEHADRRSRTLSPGRRPFPRSCIPRSMHCCSRCRSWVTSPTQPLAQRRRSSDCSICRRSFAKNDALSNATVHHSPLGRLACDPSGPDACRRGALSLLHPTRQRAAADVAACTGRILIRRAARGSRTALIVREAAGSSANIVARMQRSGMRVSALGPHYASLRAGYGAAINGKRSPRSATTRARRSMTTDPSGATAIPTSISIGKPRTAGPGNRPRATLRCSVWRRPRRLGSPTRNTRWRFWSAADICSARTRSASRRSSASAGQP